MRTKCPVCGKKFEMPYPSLWAYNINKKQFFCGWKCIQKYREQEEEKKLGITLEQKKKAVSIALGGGDPAAYLKECGSEKPAVSWANILRNLETKDPEVYEILTRKVKKPKVDKGMPKKLELEAGENYEVSVGDAMGNMKDAADEFFGKCEDMGLNIEMAPEEVKPLTLDEFEIAGIRHQDLGEWYYDKKFNSIDWRTPEGDEVSLPPVWWKQIVKDLPKILRLLGVDE